MSSSAAAAAAAAGDSMSDCGDPREEAKRVKSREASRRFRQKKKEQEKTLAEENAVLKDEMEQLRRMLAGTGIGVSSLANDMAASIRVAAKSLVQGLPEALLPTIQKALAARRGVTTSVVGAIRNLPRIINPIGFSEIHVHTMVRWLELDRAGVEPEDPIDREIYHMFSNPKYKGLPLAPAQKGYIRTFLQENEERTRRMLETKRRVRKLLEEVVSLADEFESEDRWFSEALEKNIVGVMNPEQIAGRFAWIEEQLPLFQESIIGYRFDLVPNDDAVPSPVLSHASHSPPAPAFSPAVYPHVDASPSPSPESFSSMHRTADPAAAASGGLRRPAPRAAAAPAPAGAGIPPDMLRDLIREAVTRELAQYLQDSAPHTPQGSAAPLAAADDGAAPAPDEPTFLPVPPLGLPPPPESPSFPGALGTGLGLGLPAGFGLFGLGSPELPPVDVKAEPGPLGALGSLV
eukprot:tig00000194_g14833.t1